MPIIDINFDNFSFQLEVFDKETLSDQLKERGYHGYNDLDIFKNLIKPNSTVLDIGANIGWYTVIAAQLVGPRGQIHAFEPDPTNVNMLKKNMSLNNICNVKIHAVAVLDRDGMIDFYQNPENYGDHSISPWTYQRCFVVDQNYSNPTSIPCARIDNLLSCQEFQNVSFIKMDIQGSECRALAGLEKYLHQHRPPILLEYSPAHIYHAKSSPFEIFAFIDKNQYLPYEVIPQDQYPARVQPIAVADLFKKTQLTHDDFGNWTDLLLMPTQSH